MKILKKLIIMTTIICLFFSFSFLVGFSSSRVGKTLDEVSRENIFMDDGDEDGNGEKGSGIGLNIDALISLVQEATEKHLAILARIRGIAPEAAWGGLDRAIEVSIRGSIRAIEALSKIKPSKEDNGNNGLKTFHIIASYNRGGTIISVPEGIQFTKGESVTLDFKADEGYTLVWVRVDNEKFDGATKTDHTFKSIEGNHIIHAHFKKIRE
jgi:hypothetical protein